MTHFHCRLVCTAHATCPHDKNKNKPMASVIYLMSHEAVLFLSLAILFKVSGSQRKTLVLQINPQIYHSPPLQVKGDLTYYSELTLVSFVIYERH